MFGFFKRKPETPALALVLTFSDGDFIAFVKERLEKSEPAVSAMCTVAYQNLEPMLAACAELSRTERAGEIPADLDAFIRMLSAQLEKLSDDLPRRRLMWFYLAALIRRATEIASNKEAHHSQAAAIWILLARGSGHLSALLPKNDLWADDEKAYFTDIKNRRDGIWYCLQILSPGYLRNNKDLVAFATSHEILLLPKL